MPADLRLRYDPALRRCDLVLTPAGFALDTTPQSALLMSVLSDRRAHADDTLPATMPEDPAAPAMLAPRRGWAGDALDQRGELTGSRLWLLRRAKATEAVRASAERWTAEAIAWLGRRGLTVAAAATWLRADTLRITARAGGEQVTITRQVA